MNDATRQAKRGAPRPPEPPRSRLGEYELLRPLGHGACARVYEALQPSLRRHVALKVMEPSGDPDDTDELRFEREAWIGGRLSHPNIVRVFAHGQDGPSRYIAMELAEGGSLASELARGRNDGPPTRERLRQLLDWFVGVADGLAHVHARGIIHRDIKPLNLLLSADGTRLLVSDFGLARDTRGSRVTQRGDFLGTVRYMSPEQLLAGHAPVDHRSDIWSLGVSLYEAVSGRTPHDASSAEALISAIVARETPSVRRQAAGLPRDLETVLAKCLDRDPKERYQSAAELRDDLRRLRDGESIRARPASVARRVRRTVMRHGLTIVFALVAAGSVAVIGDWRQRAERRAELLGLINATFLTDVSPANSERWPLLQPTLARMLARDPSGELVTRACRAAVMVRCQEMRAGLAPVLGIDVSRLFALPMDGDIEARISFAWDGQDPIVLKPIRLPLRSSPGEPTVIMQRLMIEPASLLSAAHLAPGPHFIDVTARCRVLEGSDTSAAIAAFTEQAPRIEIIVGPPAPWSRGGAWLVPH